MTTVTAATSLSNPLSRRLNPTVIAVGVVILVALILPFVVSSYRTLQLTQILIYAIALLGLNLLTGFSGQISLGNGAFYAVGGYMSVILMTHANLPYWAAPPVAGVICFGVGYAFGRSVARLEGLYLALATFALATALPHFLKLDALEKWTGGSQGIVFSKPASPLPSTMNDDQYLYMFVLAVAIALYVIGWNIVRGRTGRALVAIRDQPIAAATMGVDIVFYKSATFGVSALYTGVAGSLAALITGFISPDNFQIVISIQFLVGVVVGGIASIMWMLFGAVFIQLVPDVANNLSQSAPDVLYGILLIGFMMVMPGGVAGVVRSATFWLARRARARASTPRTST
jgi:branched-chain amino acid transport system permease protein